ncbi:MAG: ATP-binding protein, partial [Acidobacteria bacterium]|nr:ATP-binding protein [Acidobacteriota bacterium]
MKNFAWYRTLLLSGLALGVQRFAEAAHGGGTPLALAAVGGAIAAEVAFHFLIQVAHGQREEAERQELAARNQHVRRGMAAALRRALPTVPKPPGKLYERLSASWDRTLALAVEDDGALERLFPAEVFAESHWRATNPYSPNLEEDSSALAGLLREWLIQDAGLYRQWTKEESVQFAQKALPFYQQAFADDLIESDGLLSQAFTVKGINEIRAFTLRALPLLQQLTKEQRVNHAEVMQALRKLLEAKPRPKPFPSNIPSRLNRPFVGRDRDLATIERMLGSPSREAVLVLHGAAGVGKSELAREFARRRRQHYPGGTFFANASPGALAIDFAAIGKNNLQLRFPPDLPVPDQAQQTFYSLGTASVLLIYDNVVSVESIRPWLPAAGMACHVLITTLLDQWDAWPSHQVKALSDDDSLQLIEELSDAVVARRFGSELARFAAGLPVEICPMAVFLAKLHRRGRLDSARLFLVPEAEGSFRAAYELLETPARLLLHAAAFLEPEPIPRDELFQHLESAAGWSKEDMRN